MASNSYCSFLPSSLSFLTPSSSSVATSAIAQSKSRAAPKSSLQIVSVHHHHHHRHQQQQQQQGASAVDGSQSRSGEMVMLPAARLSRRELLGLGAMLAATGVGMAIVAPQTNAAASAATPECAELTETPSGLAFCDAAVGSGIPASKGLLIKAHYSGRLENGKIFDSSYNRGKPLVFRVGVGEVIRGWDQGILGTEGIPPMLAGGKRTLRIPSRLGYGERGAGCRGGACVIPPNSVLIFDVEFVGKP